MLQGSAHSPGTHRHLSLEQLLGRGAGSWALVLQPGSALCPQQGSAVPHTAPTAECC